MKKISLIFAALLFPLTTVHSQSFNFTVNPSSVTMTNSAATFSVVATITATQPGATSYSWNVYTPAGSCPAMLVVTNYTQATLSGSCCGVYSIVAVAMNDNLGTPIAQASHTFEVQCSGTTGLENDSPGHFSISPNPTAGKFTIALDRQARQVAIIDLTGKVLLERETRNTDVEFDLSHLPAGVYFVKATFRGDLNRISRVIVQRN